MTMSDRIAVMNDGVVEQVATPRELYQSPGSVFVAGFIGTSNLITLRVDERRSGSIVMSVAQGEQIVAPDPGDGRHAVQVTVRPEWIKLGPGELGPNSCRVSGTVADVVYLGSVTQLLVDLRTGERLSVHYLNDRVVAEDPRPGESVVLHWASENSYVIARGLASRDAAREDASGPPGLTTTPRW